MMQVPRFRGSGVPGVLRAAFEVPGPAQEENGADASADWQSDGARPGPRRSPRNAFQGGRFESSRPVRPR